MGIRRSGYSSSLQPLGRVGAVHRPTTRSRKALPTLAFAASMCFVLVAITDPTAAVAMTAETDEAVVIAPAVEGETQTVVVANVPALPIARDHFTITAAPPPPPPAPEPVAAASPGSAKPSKSAGAPAAGTPNPGSAQAIAHEMVLARGWGEGEFSCLVSLWKKESGWNTFAENKSSGAYGIPQALPGSKMASVGGDWATNPATQITWGLGYISGRYATPCGAWGHSVSSGWY
jgi:hypothetical protein